MGDNLRVALGVLVKDLTRRAFFRGTRTAVVGGAALAVTAAVGLPALPKKKLIPFKFDRSKVYTIEWGKSYYKGIRSVPFSTWRKLYSHPTLRF